MMIYASKAAIGIVIRRRLSFPSPFVIFFQISRTIHEIPIMINIDRTLILWIFFAVFINTMIPTAILISMID